MPETLESSEIEESELEIFFTDEITVEVLKHDDAQVTFLVSAPMEAWNAHRNLPSAVCQSIEPVFFIPDTDSPTSKYIQDTAVRSWTIYELLREQGVPDDNARLVLPLSLMESRWVTTTPQELLRFIRSVNFHEELELIIEGYSRFIQENFPDFLEWKI